MTTLLMLAVIAMTAVVSIGIAAEIRQEHRQFQANTLKRRVLSYFFLGTCMINRKALSAPPAVFMRLAQAYFEQIVHQPV